MVIILYLRIAFLVWIFLYISKIKRYKKENFKTLSFSSYYEEFKFDNILYSLFWIITFILVPLIIYGVFKISNIIEYFGDKVNITAFKILQIDLIVIIAGAIGNFIDRVTKGYVVDYFYFKLIDFPVFNVADCYITVAVIVMLIMCFFVLKEKELDYLIGSKKKWQVEDESK